MKLSFQIWTIYWYLFVATFLFLTTGDNLGTGSVQAWAGGSAGGPPVHVSPLLKCGTGTVEIDSSGEEEKNSNVTNKAETAQPGQVTWQVSVLTKKMGSVWRHWCGGALITNQAVLTSASCVENLNAGFVRVQGAIVDLPKGGFVRRRRFTYPGQLLPGLAYVEKIVKHPQYNKATGEHNLAVLRLATALDFTKAEGQLNIVCLPTEPVEELMNDEDKDSNVEVSLFVSGWGHISTKMDTTKLRSKLQLKQVKLEPCNVWRNDNEFCATQGKVLQCEGDIGAPIYTSNQLQNGVDSIGSTLIGIQSRGNDCSTTKDSADPLMYTDVYPYLNWIKDASKSFYSFFL